MWHCPPGQCFLLKKRTVGGDRGTRFPAFSPLIRYLHSEIMLIAASIIFIAETEHEMYPHVWISGAAVFCLLCGCSEKPADASRPPAVISCSDPAVVHLENADVLCSAQFPECP